MPVEEGDSATRDVDLLPNGTGVERHLQVENDSDGLHGLGRLLTGVPPGPGLDWEQTLDLARRHGVSSLLFWRLREQESGWEGVPEGVRERLQEAFYTAAARAMVAEWQLAQILKALSEAGVPTLVVKGAAVGAFYPDPALRSYADLDLLVPRDQLNQAEETLNRIGYQGFDQKRWRLERHLHLPPMVGDHGWLTVEVHWRLDDPERVGILPVEELWARAVPWLVEGQLALRLEAVDATLHLCRHAVVQHLVRMGLRPVCDLVQVLNGWGQAEWDTLTRRAKGYGLERAVYLMLLLAEQSLELCVPVGVQEALYPRGHQRLPTDLADRFLALETRPATRMPATAMRAWSKEALWTRVAYLLQHFFLSRDGMAALHNVPPDSPRIWLTYLWHPLYLLRRYGRAMWNTLRGDAAARAAWKQELWLERWLREVDGVGR